MKGKSMPRKVIVMMIMTLIMIECHLTQPISVTELRGVWITNIDSSVLDSREAIAEAMQFLATHHFNLVFPVVWNDALTLYPSVVMDSLFGIKIDPRFAGRDPLAELLEEAHSRDIVVMPWFEYGFAASFQKNGGTILARKPEWAARDRSGKILTKNGFEWMNGYHPEVQNFLLALILEVVENYNVDGVQGDDRLPAQPVEGGYSDYTQQLYAAEHQGQPPPNDYQDPTWQCWRADRLNEFAQQVYQKVKALKPEVLVTWAPSIYPWSYDEYLQDWPAWIRGGYADLVIPQVYRNSFDQYKKALDSQSSDSLKLSAREVRLIYPGILLTVGDYLITSDHLQSAVRYNRFNGFQGEVYFFYEGLRKNQDTLARVLLDKAYQSPAALPF
jgi:uncharacterized lipoprotein YddW (UPF0748 family)